MKEIFEGVINYRVVEGKDETGNKFSNLCIEMLDNGKKNTLVFENCGSKDKICGFVENLLRASVDSAQIQYLLDDFNS